MSYMIQFVVFKKYYILIWQKQTIKWFNCGSDDGLSSFDSDGFSIGDWNNINQSTINYVGWNWKMGTAFSNDASATSVGTIDSTGSVNTTNGQAIISYTGTGSNGTIAHGLDSVLTG